MIQHVRWEDVIQEIVETILPIPENGVPVAFLSLWRRRAREGTFARHYREAAEKRARERG